MGSSGEESEAMFHRQRANFLAVIPWVLIIVFMVGRVELSRADMIVLRGGGQIQGKVVPDPKDPGRVQVLLLKGRNPLSFEKPRIVEVIPKASPLDAYVVKREKAARDAQAQYDLGLWCESNQLPDLAPIHYEAALTIDKSFEPAHLRLGHVRHDGHWLTQDELRTVQGLVKYKGRWITEEERVKREEEAQFSASRASWVRRIKLLRQAILTGTEDRRREAESEMMSITEAEAVVPLVRVLGDDETPMRILLAHVLGRISGKEASRALVNLILTEPDNEVRAATLNRLKERDDPAIVTQLVKALGSPYVKVVNRAAWALGNLDAVGSVPKLIHVLLTQESRLAMIPPEGGGPGAMSGGAMPAIPIAFNGSSIAYMVPPVVGPGSVAYGATTAPFYSPGQLLPGVGVSSPNRGPIPRLVTFTYQNVEVRDALVKLTGQDFGYDIDAWRRWVATSFNPRPTPVRRVPQP